MGLQILPSDYTWDYEKNRRITFVITKKTDGIKPGYGGITCNYNRITLGLYSDYISIKFIYVGLQLST